MLLVIMFVTYYYACYLFAILYGHAAAELLICNSCECKGCVTFVPQTVFL